MAACPFPRLHRALPSSGALSVCARLLHGCLVWGRLVSLLEAMWKPCLGDVQQLLVSPALTLCRLSLLAPLPLTPALTPASSILVLLFDPSGLTLAHGVWPVPAPVLPSTVSDSVSWRWEAACTWERDQRCSFCLGRLFHEALPSGICSSGAAPTPLPPAVPGWTLPCCVPERLQHSACVSSFPPTV